MKSPPTPLTEYGVREEPSSAAAVTEANDNGGSPVTLPGPEVPHKEREENRQRVGDGTALSDASQTGGGSRNHHSTEHAMGMKLVSVNVSLPRKVAYEGREFETGIFKEPVTGSVSVGTTNIDGDGQADLSVHGGPHKAVYAYPLEHYPYWSNVLGRELTSYGHFGENLTTQGAMENEIHIGDVLKIGTTVLQVSQPRTPCFKLAMKMGRQDFPSLFLKSKRVGFYMRVLQEGTLRAGDAITLLERDAQAMTVEQVVELMLRKDADEASLLKAASMEALSPEWKEKFRRRALKER